MTRVGPLQRLRRAAPDGPGAPGSPGGPRAFRRPVELALYAVAPLATLITAPILARTLGPVGRGELGVVLSLCQFALTVGAWGQAETYLVEARNGRLGTRQQTRIGAVGGLVTAVLVVVLLLALGIPLQLAVLAAVWVPLLNQTNLWRSVSIAAGDLRAPALANAAGPVLRVVVLVLLAAGSLVTAESAAVTTQAALCVGGILTVGLAARRLRRPGATVVPLLQLLRRGAAIIAFDVFNALAIRSDLIVLQIFADPRQVGIYAAPASLTASALALSIPFKSRMQSAVIAGRPSSVVVREAFPVLVLAAVGAVVLWFAAPFLTAAFFGPQFAGSLIVLRLLGVAVVPLLMVDLAQGVLVVLAERRALIGVGALDAAAVVVSLFVLCPIAGPVGAAIACIIGYTVAATIAWVVVLRGLRRHLPAA